MHPVLIAVIAITVIISLAGFQNVSVFEKYKFNVSAIKYKKNILDCFLQVFYTQIGDIYFSICLRYISLGQLF